MKRILIFSLAYYPHVGGAEIAVREITDRIGEIEFHMLTLRFGKEARQERIGNIVVHRVGFGSSYVSKMLFIPMSAFAGMRLHRTLQFDALWAMMSYMSIPITLMRTVGLRLPYVLTLQEGDPFEHVFRRWFILPFLPLLRAGFRNASIIQTISNFLAGWAKEAGFAGRVEVIPNAVDTKHFSQRSSAGDLEALKKTLNKHTGDVFLITTSRLVHKNAVDDVIRALRGLPPNMKFIVLGTGSEQKKLQELAEELALKERVHFLGHIAHTNMPKYLQVSDIFIRPSRSEGMGNSFVEAMAAGIPVIATQEGGIADFLFDAKRNPDKQTTGWAVDKDAPEQIVAAVEEILGSKEKRDAVLQNAKKLVFEKYDWDLIAKNMRERVFLPLLG